MDDKATIILKHAKVLFAELKDNGYGLSITIDATDPTVKKAITEWVAANGINGGVAKFKEYTNEKTGVKTTQYQFRISDYTEFACADDKTYTKNDLGYGALINLKASAYEYNNKFGKGISASLRGVYIVEPRANNTMDGLAE